MLLRKYNTEESLTESFTQRVRNRKIRRQRERDKKRVGDNENMLKHVLLFSFFCIFILLSNNVSIDKHNKRLSKTSGRGKPTKLQQTMAPKSSIKPRNYDKKLFINF